ncbi:MAG: TonB-dependent receptor [Bacteroidales bacterium]|nr:TonB-dependent receptor [Bacteroidales bacterium]
MKKYFILLIVSILYVWPSLAQTLKITDISTLQALANVAIYSASPEASVISNGNGEADLSSFTKSNRIVITHLGYNTRVFSFDELAALNFRISLIEKSFSLDEVVVSASRFEEKLEDVAQPIQIIKSKELAFVNQQTSANVLENSGSIMVQKSQLGGGSPVIRGFETNKVLMVVDGVRMNNAIYRGGHLQNIITLDNTMMEKVELVFGPGSVVYGSDALGGVIHFYSKNPVFSETDKPLVKVNAFSRYSSAYTEKTGHIDVSVANKTFGSLSSFTYSGFGDLMQGKNRRDEYPDFGKRDFYVERINGKDSMLVNDNVNLQKQSGYKQYDFLQKLMYRPNEKISHIVNIQYSTTSDIPRYDRLTQVSDGLPKYGAWYYGPQKRLFTSYTLNLLNDKGFYDNARLVIGYQNIEESRNTRRFKSDLLSHRIEKVDILTLNIDVAKTIKRNEIRYGIDAWYNYVNSSANEEHIVTGELFPLDTRYPDGGSSMQSIAAYLTHTFEMNDHFIITDGIRLNAIKLHSKFDDTSFFPFPFDEVTQNNTALNGNLALIYMPGRDWRFTLIGSSGFRAPNVDDLSKVFESVPGTVIVPNPDLKPEYTYNAEIGISKSIAEKVRLGATAYYTWYRDAITTNKSTFNGQDSIMFEGVLSQVTMNVNAAEAYIYGFNAYLNADITDHFKITNTINYTYGRIKTDTTDYPLDHISPLFGKSSLNLHLNKFRGELSVSYSGAKKARDYNLLGEDNQSNSADPIHGYMPAWAILNLRTAYQFSEKIQLQMAVENIFDRNYRVFASNISGAGRNIVLTLRATL